MFMRLINFARGYNVNICQHFEKRTLVPYLDFLILKALRCVDVEVKLKIMYLLAAHIDEQDTGDGEIIPKDLLLMRGKKRKEFLELCRQQEAKIGDMKLPLDDDYD